MYSDLKSFSSVSFFCRPLFFLILAMLLSSCESRRTIVNGLDEKEANEILVFLSTKGINANKVQAISEGAGGGGKAVLWNISVEDSRANEAMGLLNQVGLPRRRGQNLLSLFSNVGLVPSGMQDKIRYQAGLAEQIAGTIRKIDGVLDADVQISFPDEDPLNPNANKEDVTASVYIKHSGVLDDPNSHLDTRVKRLVAGSVPGLDFDQVTVISDRARFSETPLGGWQGNLPEQTPAFVNIWSVAVSTNSVGRFQALFLSFTIAILLLLLFLILILWKILPVLKKMGGIKQLFSLKRLSLEPSKGHKTEFGEPKPQSEDKEES